MWKQNVLISQTGVHCDEKLFIPNKCTTSIYQDSTHLKISFVRVCVLLRKVWRWCLLEDEIKSSSSSSRPSGATSIVGGHVEVCSWWIPLDLVGVSYDLRFSSFVAVDALVRWLLGCLAQRLLVYLLQHVLLQHTSSDSSEGEARRRCSFSSLECFIIFRIMNRSLDFSQKVYMYIIITLLYLQENKYINRNYYENDIQ
jgi:hypothetical protein